MVGHVKIFLPVLPRGQQVNWLTEVHVAHVSESCVCCYSRRNILYQVPFLQQMHSLYAIWPLSYTLELAFHFLRRILFVQFTLFYILRSKLLMYNFLSFPKFFTVSFKN